MNIKHSPTITQQQLESYLWGAATLLRGVIDAGNYKQFIFPLLFFKRKCDVYDEEYQRALDDIDQIVRIVRFPGWQQTIAGDREVKQALRKTLLKYKLHQEQDLFDRAYEYIKQYY
jgi:type I restriction-modification system DNA methylase subunit